MTKVIEMIVSQARKNIIRKIEKIIHETRHGECDGDGGLVGRLVEEGSLRDEAISDFIINLLFAGNETTAKTMLFAIYFLTTSPEAANKLLVLCFFLCKYRKTSKLTINATFDELKAS